ncbi:hypothetical protein KJ632_05460, partial [Patescibacteria group bacterium]|nr:hypothetical protein [Patescibacteria group bacterium]
MSAFLFVSGKLFFAGVLDDIFGDDGVVSEQGFEKDVLRLVLPEDLVSVEPTLADPATRQRLLNVYESMVKLDGDLNPTPALAVNWGLIDDLTWEFRLRPNVKFHDGSFLDSRDVEASLERAMYFEKSEIAGFLNTIKNVEVFSDTILRIETYEPDPLLLQRIAMVLVF